MKQLRREESSEEEEEDESLGKAAKSASEKKKEVEEEDLKEIPKAISTRRGSEEIGNINNKEASNPLPSTNPLLA